MVPGVHFTDFITAPLGVVPSKDLSVQILMSPSGLTAVVSGFYKSAVSVGLCFLQAYNTVVSARAVNRVLFNFKNFMF